MYDKDILRNGIIRALMENGSLTEKELCACLGVSRGTLENAILSLDDLLVRDGRGYALEPSLAVAVLRADGEHISIRAYSPKKAVFDAVDLPISSALTLEAGRASAVAMLDKYRAALSQKGYRVACAFVYARSSGKPYSLPSFLKASGSIEELAAKGLESEGSCLYVHDTSFICFDGKAVTKAVVTPADRCAFLKGYFDFALPDRVLLEGEASDEIYGLCRQRGVECRFSDTASRPYVYEREIIIRALATLN